MLESTKYGECAKHPGNSMIDCPECSMERLTDNAKLSEPLLVNGRHYPLWSQFVEKKEEWIGGLMCDSGDSMDRRMGMTDMTTEITDIQLLPNGKESAMFQVVGKDFTCGFDVKYGGIGGEQKSGWLTLSGYMGHTWRIKKPEPKPVVEAIEEEEELSPEEKKATLKQFQANCKHDKGYQTNVDGPSKCVLCGKPWI